MKLIQVNSNKAKSLNRRGQSIDLIFKKIIDYLLTRRLRNKRLLVEKSEMTLVFLSAQEMRKINFQYRKKNKPTDILSFMSSDPRSLGELLLCLDVLKLQAQDQNHSLFSETSYMLIHGVLHLLGYDHEMSDQDAKTMFRLQDECFAVLKMS